jgi:hypothetical protein
VSRLLEQPEPSVTDTPEPAERRPPRALGYALLALLSYLPPLLTAPGKVAADTKQYLYLDPSRMLGRTLNMWDEHIGMGTVTHQNIGYAFPMGPYYWLMNTIGVPDWVAQRLWLGTILFVAACGVLYLLRTFGLKGPGIVIAALAYMLTPYVLDYSARISVLLLPYAALPWMIAVIQKALREPKRGLAQWRYPAIFALIVQVIGGVNATALIFAGLAPVLWIFCSWIISRDVSFRRALGVTVRTGVLTVFTSLWWIAGLRMQAGYGLDILKYTETIDAVARTSAPNEVLRGLGYWFFYGQDRLGPWIEASTDYTQHLYVIIAGYTLVALGLLGGAFLRWRYRAYFVLLMLAGVLIGVGAFPYNDPSPLGALFKAAAQGSTVGLAMRSTGRAAPLVVLALAMFIGLGTNLLYKRFRARGHTALAFATPAVVVLLLLVNFPALYDGSYYGKNLQRPGEVPSYWQQAIKALSADGDQTRILEVPGADFASYTWGNTVDPITPGLTDRPYVARELIPYGTAGSADLLNAIDRRMQEGVADPAGLAALWRRMGIGSVVARNDIQYARYNLVPPRELARVLAQTPGLGKPTAYGPPSPTGTKGFEDESSLAAPPTDPQLAPVVVYPVTDPTPIARAEAVRGGLMVSGDGEGLVDVADIGLLDNNPGVVRYSASYPTADKLRAAVPDGTVLVVTDNNRLRARKWTAVRDNLGYTEEAGEADKPLTFDNGDARLPLFEGESANAETTTVDEGAQRVRASAYGNTITYTPEDRAAKAFDGDASTAWRGNAFGDARNQKLILDLDAPITTDHVNLAQPINGGRARWITDVELRFDGKDPVHAKLTDASRAASAAGQTITFPKRTFQQFEVVVKGTNSTRTNLFGQEDAVGFAEIRLRDQHAQQDVHIREIEQMPTDMLDALGAASAQAPLIYVMRRDATRPIPPRSQPELRIDRMFTVPTDRTISLGGNGSLSPDAQAAVLESALGVRDATRGGVTASASQSLPGCFTCRADAAIDGDPTTAWQTPFIVVAGQSASYKSAKPLSFDHMDLRVVADGRHSVPTRLRLDVGGQSRIVDVPPVTDQAQENASVPVHLTFAPLHGNDVKVTILATRDHRSKRFATGDTTLEPAAIAELGIPGLSLPAAPKTIDSGCRSDLVRIDGRPVPVRMTGPAPAPGAVMTVAMQTCDPADPAREPVIPLKAGRHVLTTARGKDLAWSVDRIVLASAPGGFPLPLLDGRVTNTTVTPDATPKMEVVKHGATSLRVKVSGAEVPFWMVLGQSQSAGWQAHVVGGKDLGASQLIDGYANGWLVDKQGDFEIQMDWTPQRQVWISIWISLIAVLACLAIIGLTWRRSRFAVATAADADVSLRWRAPLVDSSVRTRIIAPLVAGFVAGLAVAPWVGLLVALLTATIAWLPKLRAFVLLIPGVALFLTGAYIALQQYRFKFPSVFEWPTVFPKAPWIAWIAVMLLVGDVLVEVFRRRPRVVDLDDGDDPD